MTNRIQQIRERLRRSGGGDLGLSAFEDHAEDDVRYLLERVEEAEKLIGEARSTIQTLQSREMPGSAGHSQLMVFSLRLAAFLNQEGR